MNILVDPGHGGSDPGACANGMREADYVLNLGKMLMFTLRERGHVAHLTRDTDTSLGDNKSSDLQARCDIENKWRPHLFVSLHCNAFATDYANGFEVWTSPGQTASDLAAEEIIDSFAATFPGRLIRRDMADGDQDKESRFRVLTGTIGPAVLVEIGFLTNAVEAAWLKQNFTAIVNALADGIDAYSSLGNPLEDCG